MEKILKTELRLITMVMSCEIYALDYWCNVGMGIYSLNQNVSILEEKKTVQLWGKVKSVVLEDDITRKAYLLSEIEKWDFEPVEKKELINLFLTTWDAGVDIVEIAKIRRHLIKKTEHRIAHNLIADFQKRLESEDFSLLEACDEFYGNIPYFEQPNIKIITLNENQKIYWNPDKIFETFLELEQSLREHRLRSDAKSVLKCYLNKEIEFSDEKIKEMLSNLGLGLVVLSKI